MRELRATVVEVPSRPAVAHVRLEGSLVSPGRLLSARAQALPLIGVVGGALFEVIVDPTGLVVWQWPVVGAVGVVAGSGFALRSYRRTVVETEAALDAFLEGLTTSVPTFTGDAPVH